MDPRLNTSDPARVIRVAKPWITDFEVNAVAETVRSGWVSNGPQVAAFERAFAEAHHQQHGIACNSGSTALVLALRAAGVLPGDRVVTSTMTMVAVANAILDVGAVPVFVDCDRHGDIDLLQAVDACWKHAAKAVVIPHLYGRPTEYDRDEFPCAVIEDCAEVHYASYENSSGELVSVGSQADFATFSFFANKIIQAGEGGIVLCQDSRQADRLRSLRAHAFSPTQHFSHQEHAYGYRMSDMQAALGLAQHKRRHEILNRRAEIAGWYSDQLRDDRAEELEYGHRPPDISKVKLWKAGPGQVWWVYPIVLADARLCRRVREALHFEGIETRTYFRPLHWQQHLRRFALDHAAGFDNANRLYRNGIYLPLYPELTEADVDRITSIIRAVLPKCETVRQDARPQAVRS